VFFITINSNKVPRRNETHEDLLVRICQRATEETFQEETADELFKFVLGFEGDTFDENVEEYRFNGNVEVGARKNLAVHSHTTVLVKHNSRLQLDVQAIKRRFMESWNFNAHAGDRLNNVYVHFVAAGHHVANWILYQQKDEADIPVQSTDRRTGNMRFIIPGEEDEETAEDED
jgi:hypothetical protein